MKKIIIFLSSIITLIIIICVVVFITISKNNNKTTIYVYSFDKKEKFVLYKGNKIDFLEIYDGDDINLIPQTIFNPGNKDEFIEKYVTNNKYFTKKYSFYYGNENQFYDEVYEFVYKGYTFYLKEQADANLSYIFFLEPCVISGDSKSKRAIFYTVGPYHLFTGFTIIDDNNEIDLDYSKIYTDIDDYLGLFNWYKSINSSFVSVDEDTLEIRLKVVNIQTNEIIDGIYILMTKDGKVKTIVD